MRDNHRTMERFPKAVFRHGEEPDVRFTFANERTFLAWIRTALALIAGGVALDVFQLDLNRGLQSAASLLLVGVGLAAPLLAFLGWARSERAMRSGRTLPDSVLGIVVTIAVTCAGILVFLAMVLR